MGIVICENILRHLDAEEQRAESIEQSGAQNAEAPCAIRHAPCAKLETIHRAVSEVGSAVFTAVMTTVVSFLPVFTMIGEEGKLFKPLAYTKTFALLASILIALAVIPPAAYLLFGRKKARKGRANSPSEPPRRNDGSAGGVALPLDSGLTRLSLFAHKTVFFRGGEHRFVLFFQGCVLQNGLWGRPCRLTA